MACGNSVTCRSNQRWTLLIGELEIVANRFCGSTAANNRAGSTADRIYSPVVIAAVSIHTNFYLLSRMHASQLCFFEVGDYPDLAQIDNRQQQLSRLDVLADFDRAAADSARGLRDAANAARALSAERR